MSTTAVFNDIQIGKSFKTPTQITYQKVSSTQAKPIKDVKGNPIANGLVSSVFYNSNMVLVVLN